MASVNTSKCVEYYTQGRIIGDCCKMDYPFPIDPFNECLEIAEEKVPRKQFLSFLACTFECYAENIGTIKNNTVLLEKAIEYIDQYPQGLHNDVRKVAWKTCAKKASQIAAALAGHKDKCNPFALEMESCIQSLVNRNCPETYYHHLSEICHEARTLPHCVHKWVN
ncbi:uncharacterized protein LOC129759122 [Uranotaenia lowii]|uniref:uncharacterized protein LOC129744242 n=1 Tax=Uranotaenia lowii TaxID=190385 RepID=UPI002478A9A9|nr:uncharacterized protein LOC129744242 [Uranotaenia lowii]XP_055612513.1 uncharacterized protein LOC129759122 [Uranotaenia lowii]